MIELCLTTFLTVAAQDPAETPPREQEPTPVRAPYEEWDDRTAREAVREFGKRMKGRSVPLKTRIEAVEALAKGRHERLVEPLAKVVMTDKAITVRQAAAKGLAHQPPEDTKRMVVRLIDHDSLKDVPQVQATLVEALQKAGYEAGRDWEALDGLFEREYSAERVPLQQAILALVKEHRELEALDMLVRNLGEPVPANPDDPSNPPASYWEARWKAWAVWRGEVKEALLAITGQRFSTEEEARTWLKKNEKELRRRR